MRIPRIYHPTRLTGNSEVQLSDEAARHVTKVLRLRPGAAVVLFDGSGTEYEGELLSGDKRGAQVAVGAARGVGAESPLTLTLAQGISRGERMDFVVQKAVELGISRIVPIITERTVVKLNGERWEKKHRHWASIVVSACEQSGRTVVPLLSQPMAFDKWLEHRPENGFLLEPQASASLPRGTDVSAATLLIGPEGGLSKPERERAYAGGYSGLRLGPRILRTETAALAAVTLLQAAWGDLQ